MRCGPRAEGAGDRAVVGPRCALLGLLLVLTWPAAGRGQPLVADLSRHLVAITTVFSGTDLVLFGALRDPAGRVAVVVQGPGRDVRIRRRERVGPFWLVTREVRFRDVPAFYAVLGEGGDGGGGTGGLAATLGLDLKALVARLEAEGPVRRRELAEFRAALLRKKRARGLYLEDPAAVRRIGDILFRGDLHFPGAVPPGNYRVRTLYLRDGRIAHAQTNVLFVSKVGLEAELSDFARRRPALYGLTSVVIAMIAGFGANALLGRR